MDKEETHSEETTQEHEIDLGQYLKSYREKKNLSLEAISQQTKISLTLLQNLESNAIEQLPNNAYLIGFIKSYCRMTGADSQYALDLLSKAQGESFTPKKEPQEISIDDPQDFPLAALLSSKVIGALFVIVFLIIFIRFGFQKSKEIATSSVKTQKVTAQTPLQSSKKQEKVEPTPIPEETKKEVAKPEKVEPTPIPKETKEEVTKPEKVEPTPIPEETKKEEETAKVEEKPKVNLRPIPGVLYSIGEQNEEQNNLLIPEKFKNSLITGKQNVFLNAVDGDSWITYKSDEGPIKKFVLRQGRTLMIRGDEVRLFLGNTNVVRVFLNNQLLSIKAPSGVKSLVFPKENKDKFKLPLFIYQKNGQVLTSDEYEKTLN